MKRKSIPMVMMMSNLQNLVINGSKGSDNFQTPEWPIKALTKVIHKKLVEKTILDPCCGKGHLRKTLNDQGYYCIGTDIDRGFNFLTTNPNSLGDYDLIITNPPYSLKDEFLERCYNIGKPFALLMPLTALEGQKRLALYKKNGMQLALLPKRVNFIPPTEGKKSSAWFPTAWFTYGFNLDKDLIYLEE
jgi:hypothetical protein